MCGHTFCRACVIEKRGSLAAEEGNGTCPTCGQSLPDPDALAVNTQMQGMVAFYLMAQHR